MILKKVNVNGKELYEEIEDDEVKAEDVEQIVIGREREDSNIEVFGDDKNQKLIKLFPFMDEKDLLDIANKIIDGEEGYKELPIASVIPFIEDADEIFLKLIEKNNPAYSTIVPFVSTECLSNCVDKYTKGEIDICFDDIYPFLENDDIVKLFTYYIEHRDK